MSYTVIATFTQGYQGCCFLLAHTNHFAEEISLSHSISLLPPFHSQSHNRRNKMQKFSIQFAKSLLVVELELVHQFRHLFHSLAMEVVHTVNPLFQVSHHL